MRRGILKRATCDLKGRGGRWTSKCDNIRGTSIIVSLKRDEIMYVSRLTGGENFASSVFRIDVHSEEDYNVPIDLCHVVGPIHSTLQCIWHIRVKVILTPFKHLQLAVYIKGKRYTYTLSSIKHSLPSASNCTVSVDAVKSTNPFNWICVSLQLGWGKM